MNCHEVSRLLDAYVDNELELPASAGVSEHVEACPACQHRLAELESIKRLVQTLPYYTAPERLRAAVTAKAPRWGVSPRVLALAAAVADLCVSACWTMCHDVAGDAAGTATGCMNTFGNLGGAISPLVVGYAVQWWGSWSTPLIVTAGVCALCGLLTLTIDPTRRLRVSEHALTAGGPPRPTTLVRSDSRSLSTESHL